MSITENAAIGQVSTAASTLNVKLPTAVTAAIDGANRLTAAAGGIGPRRDALVEAFAAAVDRDVDPAGDAAVQRVIAAQALSADGMTRAIGSLGAARVRDALIEHADDVVDALRGPFDRAAAILVTAYEQLGHVSLDETTTILAQGGDAAATWGEAQTAVRCIRTVADGWHGLATVAHVPVNPNRAVLRIADVAPEQWLELDVRKADPWQLVAAGAILSLPTISQYIARNRALDEHLAQPEVAVDRWRSHVAGHEIRVPV